MNKKIILKKQTIALFVVNVLILILSLIFKDIYEKLHYYTLIINIFFFINMLFLIMGIVINLLMVIKQNSFDYKKTIKILIVYFLFYIILNTFVIFLTNKPISDSFNKTTNKLINYCQGYECDTFETNKNNDEYEFILEKNYIDYSNNTNFITIKNYYNKQEVVKIVAQITSKNEMFSEHLIKEQVSNWFDNFKCDISEELIKEAFIHRFDDEIIKKDNVVYKVSETYENKVLIGLKTTITLNIK